MVVVPLLSVVKMCCAICAYCINTAILDCKFPDELKKADVSPVFKGHNPTSKVDFRPIIYIIVYYHLPPNFMKEF